jgi:probable rRNA maturation factor
MGSTKPNKNITVQITKNFKNADARLPQFKKLVETVCNRFKLTKATVSIAIVDDTQIRKLNKQFLNKNAATDCLSFDLSDNNTDPEKSFELIVNAEMAAKEAKLRGHSNEAELALYITHGLLHNLGFDDSTPAKAKKMHETEDEILRQFGYGLIYGS